MQWVEVCEYVPSLWRLHKPQPVACGEDRRFIVEDVQDCAPKVVPILSKRPWEHFFFCCENTFCVKLLTPWNKICLLRKFKFPLLQFIMSVITELIHGNDRLGNHRCDIFFSKSCHKILSQTHLISCQIYKSMFIILEMLYISTSLTGLLWAQKCVQNISPKYSLLCYKNITQHF